MSVFVWRLPEPATFLKTGIWIANTDCFQNSVSKIHVCFKPIVILKYPVIVIAEVWAFERAHVLCMRVEGGASDCWTEMLQKAPSVTVPLLYPLCFSLQLQPCRFLTPPQHSQCTWQHKQQCACMCVLIWDCIQTWPPSLIRPWKLFVGLRGFWKDSSSFGWSLTSERGQRWCLQGPVLLQHSAIFCSGIHISADWGTNYC